MPAGGVAVSRSGGELRIGAARCPLHTPAEPALVPDIVFFDIPQHTRILEAMLADLSMGEHLLLIGNQGDSPLVRAMEKGRVLLVDEFDKAPAEVVCVLKGLLDDGEILLGDGRRFHDPRRAPLRPEDYDADERARLVAVHPDFRVVALANRPGFPFLGNDFFREMGDVFALRRMADEGLVSYPYSTREVVNVARHLDRFPQDTVADVVENVFAFDFDAELRRQLHDVFRRHGIPIRRTARDGAGEVAGQRDRH
eukprot:gene3180-65_t